MELFFDIKVNKLASVLSKPLYAVGGYVRNFLIDQSLADDVDLAGAIPIPEITDKAKALGLFIVAEYPRTGTVVFSDGKLKYEYTCFRKEEYRLGGEHKPIRTEFTDDIIVDAKRRDFKCNAVYYDINEKKIVDPLDGVNDIKNKVLDSVIDADKVFSHDGLRLMRLARLCGELGFSPSKRVMVSAKKNAKNICDISAERIYDELKKILRSDGKYPFSDKKGHYHGLKILSETGVLDYVMPELTLGRNMFQRSDFHDHDVLEHSLRCVLYAHESVRLDALLHDVGKPYCMIEYGRYHDHPFMGEEIARKILNRLTAENDTIKRVCFMVKNHMLDIKNDVKESKLRRFIVENYKFIPQLLMVKQADFSGSKDDLSKAPTVDKWEKLIEKMRSDGTPFCLKELNITSNELQALGYNGKALGDVMNELNVMAILNPTLNENTALVKIATRNKKNNY